VRLEFSQTSACPQPLHKPRQRNYNFNIVAMLPRMLIHVKGTTGLVIAAVIMIAVLVAVPAYRLFLAISVAIGIVFALIFHLRNRYRPVEDKDVDNKRPLGLD
jgi:Mn2+/Fe2+ NRAMP family transporter